MSALTPPERLSSRASALLGPGHRRAGRRAARGAARRGALGESRPTVLPAPRCCRRPSGAVPAASSSSRSAIGTGGDARMRASIRARAAEPYSPPPAATARTAMRSARRSPRAERLISPDALPQLGAQRRRRLLGHRHRCDAAVDRAVRPRCELRRGLLEALTQVAAEQRRGAAASPMTCTTREPLQRRAPDPRRLRRGAGARARAQRARRSRASTLALQRSARRHARRRARSKRCAARSRRRAACRCSRAWRAARSGRVVLDYLAAPQRLRRRAEHVPLDHALDRAAHPAQGAHVPAG